MRNPAAADYVRLVLKVPARHRDLLRRFGVEDGRNMSREFEHLMDEESAKRLRAQTTPVGGVAIPEEFL